MYVASQIEISRGMSPHLQACGNMCLPTAIPFLGNAGEYEVNWAAKLSVSCVLRRTFCPWFEL